MPNDNAIEIYPQPTVIIPLKFWFNHLKPCQALPLAAFGRKMTIEERKKVEKPEIQLQEEILEDTMQLRYFVS